MAETFTPREVMEAAKEFRTPESKERPEADVPVRDETGGRIGFDPSWSGAREYVEIGKFTKTPEDGTVLTLEKPDTFNISFEVGKTLHPSIKERSPEGTVHIKRLTRDESVNLVTEGRKMEDMRNYLPQETLEKLEIKPIEG